MSKDFDETPAFPVSLTVGGHGKAGPVHHQFSGMSLRDYFAAAALQRFLPWDYSTIGEQSQQEWHDRHVAGIARHSYAIADALLKERAK